jgi:hypothetical protein
MLSVTGLSDKGSTYMMSFMVTFSLNFRATFRARIAGLVFAALALSNQAFAACEFTKSLAVPVQPNIDTKIKHAYGLADGSAVFLGRLFIDADGAPKAYHKASAVALDDLENAGAPSNWWALATDAPDCGPAGKPIVQNSADPAPGYYVAMTSMVNPAIDDCRRQRKYVDAQVIPYVALSRKIRTFDYGRNRGALVLVVNVKTGKRSFAVFADQAPDYGFGEGSILLGKRLGYDASPKTGGTPVRENVFIVFKDSLGFPKDAAAVAAAGARAFAKWGGEARLKECAAKVKSAPH